MAEDCKDKDWIEESDLETMFNEEHKKINGDLRQLNNELIKDNQNLAKQVDDNINKLRKAGVI